MILTPGQINELLSIIDRNQLLVIGEQLGTDFLTDADRALLGKSGVDLSTIYTEAGDSLYTNFHLGMLAESLGAARVSKLTYTQLKEYISKGQYIPLTQVEKATIQAARNQTFTDIKRLGNRIFQDVNQVLANGSLQAQRDLIREELVQGTIDKKTVSEISREIADRTGDWSRDFDRIIACASHQVYEEGKAAMIERNSEETDPSVYKLPAQGACDHCVRLYLTKGWGSQPIVFKLSELRANGTNIGRKVKDWKAVIGFVHPYCRCRLFNLPKGYIWDGKQFRAPSKQEYIPRRKPIRVWIAGQVDYI